MRYIPLVSLAIGVAAALPQQGPAPPPRPMPLNLPGCSKISDIKPLADPFAQFPVGVAQFPCDMGGPIPLGPIPTGCAKYEVIVARGTSEPGDFGSMVGDPLVARVHKLLPDARGYPVQYPADGFGFSSGIGGKTPSPAEIAEHQAIGPIDIVKRISDQTKSCPGTKFALVGYSQGGMVTYGAASVLASQHPDLAKNVVAVVLYGAGDGTQIALPQSEVLANCARGDLACPAPDNPMTLLGHVTYNDQGSKWHDRSAQFIVSAFEGKPLGPKLKKTATEEL